MQAAKKSVTYHLPVALLAELAARAKREERKKSAVVERALRAYLARHPQPADARATCSG